MKYSIETGESIAELEKDVNEKMKTDWEPVGGVVVINDAWSSSMAWIQAMVNKGLTD